MDGQLAAAVLEGDVNIEAEQRAEFAFDRQRVGVLGDGALAWRGLAFFRRAGVFRQVFGLADAKALGDDLDRQTFGVRRADLGAGVTGAERAFGDSVLDGLRQR